MSGEINLVLLSGGLDSTVNFLIARERGGVEVAVTVDYGQRSSRRETERARALCGAYGVRHLVLDAGWLARFAPDALVAGDIPPPRVGPEQLADKDLMRESMSAVWVPNRNGLLANMGACVAEAEGLPWIVMGLNAEEAATFPDNSAAFVRETNHALGYSTRSHVKLRSFTITWDKMDIMREAIARELDFRYLWSCYNGEELMCGRCESCARLIASARRTGEAERLRGLFSHEL
jgi:Predicted PP-loop superfamily ATPase